MVFEVEITSKEMIKPSSPTPQNLKNLKLSFLDQVVPSFYEPMIFYYQADHLPKDLPQLLQTLKHSLSLVLTQFYPLAGRFSKENYTIECNDSGTLFLESKVHANLLDVIKDPIMDDLEKLLALRNDTVSLSEADTVVLAVQINLFDCGGIAIAAQLHHNCGDAISQVNFMNAWAAASKGNENGNESEIPPPTFDLANIFPPKDMSASGYKPSTGVGATAKIVAKRFIFDKKQLEKLKNAETESSKVKNPSRVESVTSFIFKHFKDAARAKGSKKSLGVVHTVNLRPKTDPPLSNHVFGNVWRHAIAIPRDNDLVASLRDAIKKLDGDYVKELQSGDEYLNNVKKSAGQYMKGEMELWSFTSVGRLPVYEVDYGWGRPVWVSPGKFPSKNLVILMSTSSGDGIEAWVHLLEEDAASMHLNLGQVIKDL